LFVRRDALILCKDRADSLARACALFGDNVSSEKHDAATGLGHITLKRERAMKLTIEIVAAALLVFCIAASSAAFAAGAGRSADGLSCGYRVPANASPAARCAAIRRQCGGKFYASACGSKMLSAAN
jgi:hypothetical protein